MQTSYKFFSKLLSIFYVAIVTTFGIRIRRIRIRSKIFFSAILWDLEGSGCGRGCPYTTRSSYAEIGNNPINQDAPAGAITFRGWTQLAEPNPSRKYCPLRTDAAFSSGPPPFLPLSVSTSFFLRRSHDPAATQGIFLVCASHAGVVDDTRASSPSRASLSCSFITARRSCTRTP